MAPAQQFRFLFQPINIGRLRVKNRLMMNAHGTRLPNYRILRYIEERARGGVGLIVFGAAITQGARWYHVGPPTRFIRAYAGDRDVARPSLNSPEGQAYYDEVVTPMLKQLAEITHRHGAVCFGQLYQDGAFNHGEDWQPKIAPSPIPDPWRSEIPHELEPEEIKELVGLFGETARRVKAAGIDGVELHAAHGSLFQEFMSPHTNHRNDAYGGSLENRLRLIIEVIAAIKSRAGDDYPIGIRLPADEFVEGGLNLKDCQEIARRLSGLVDYLNVSVASEAGIKDGLTLMTVPPWYVPSGPLVPLAGAIRQVVKTPVMVSVRINDPVQAEKILEEGQADMVGMVRAFIADPEFANKARAGDIDDIRKCLGCNEGCRWRTLQRGSSGLPIGCTVNAAAGREEEMEIIPAARRKKVLVVGGGPAGLEAARVAALRGHKVTLCEKEAQLGGQVRLFTIDPHRQEFGQVLDYLTSLVKKLGVEIKTQTEVTPEYVRETGAKAVIMATGSTPLVPAIPGANRPNVLTSWQVLKGEKEAGKRVVVIGGLEEHQAPLSLAEFLADRGKQVEVLSELRLVGEGIEPGTLWFLTQRLLQKGVTLTRLTAVKAIAERQVVTCNILTKAECIIEPVDTVVLAMGNQANNNLYLKLKGTVKELYPIGDCLAPRRVIYAILEGSRIGRYI